MQMRKTKTGILLSKLLLNSSLIFIVATTISADKNLETNINECQINSRLSNKIMPIHYSIKLIIPDIRLLSRDNDFFQGECTIKIQVKSDTSHITLHSIELHIQDVWLSDICNTENCDMSDLKKTKITKAEWNIQSNMTLLLSFPINISPGHYILNIKYTCDLNLYEAYERNVPEISDRELLIATNSIPIGARQVFPCLDEPRYKTPFNISIGHSTNYTTFSNMPVRMYEKEKDIVWTHFETTPAISTFSVMMMITSFNLIALPKLHGRFDMWCNEKCEIQVQWTYNLVELITDFLIWNIDNQDEYMMDYIVMPGIPSEIRENLGLSIYRQEDIICDTEIDPLGCRMKVERIMGRSIAYTWFGNKISPCSWSYSWLNEGLSTFFGLYAVYKTVPNSQKAMHLIVIQDQHEALHLDTHYTMGALTSKVNSPSEIKSLFSYLHYLKAPAIIRMLQHIVTTEMFIWRGITTFYTEYKFKVVTPDDLWNILQDTLDKSHVKYGGYMLRNVMNTWTKQQYYPVVKVIRDYNNHTVMISQENINTTHQTQWWIPITYTTHTRPDFSNTFPDRWLRPSVQNLVLDGVYHDNDWIILNLQQTGYYRVNYDRMNWLLIVKYLYSEDYDKIHVLNRAQFIDDAYHFLIRYELDEDIFLYIIRYLSREIDYIAWYPMFKIFEYLSNFSPFITDSAVVKLDFINILHQLLEKLTYNESYEDYYTICLRQEAMKWACFFGDYKCKIEANIALKKHLYDNTVIAPGLVDWVMCNGLNIANTSTWDKYLDKKHKNSWEHLALLRCSEVSDIIILSLHQLIDNSENSRKNLNDITFMNIMYPIIMKHADNYIPHILPILKEYRGYDKIKILVIIINHMYSEDTLNFITKFVEVGGLTEQMLADIQYVITTRSSNIKNRKTKISQWFRME